MSTSLEVLTKLPAALAAYVGGPAPGYRQIYNEVVDGKLSMITSIRGRWHFNPADVPAIAAALRLSPVAPAARTPRRRAESRTAA